MSALSKWIVFTIPVAMTYTALPSRAITEKQAQAEAAAIVHRMTLPEKIRELHGIQDAQHSRYVPGIPHLGIPPLIMTNGPAGVGPGNASPQPRATGLPAPVALASTWDPKAARRYGEIGGKEARDLGVGLLEGPDVNIARVPQNGRTFEGYGEDPVLSSKIAVAEIEGVQSTGIMANVKHFVANNQETSRGHINELVGERALHEIYMPAFKAAVQDANVASVMCAYPQLNGEFNCANKFLLTDVLKDQWHFNGFVISDWGAVHSTVPSALAGLDLEMPTGKYFSTKLEAAAKDGQISVSVINDKLIRRFSKMIEFGLFDQKRSSRPIPVLADGVIARSIADEGAVLLKNQNRILPLHAMQLHNVVLIGPYAVQAYGGGGGSSHVIPLYSIQPQNGLQARLPLQLHLRVLDGSSIPEAVAAAKKADVAIVIVGDEDTEGRDQPLTLPGNQNALIQAVAIANPHTVVVLQTGSAVLMPWLHDVPAVLETWYPGEEDGDVLGDLLFGYVNPSGKLPITFPAKVSNTFANSPMQYPGNEDSVDYSEGVDVGYRWYQSHHVKPLFPFGFGLSYTTFAFSNLSVADANRSQHQVTLRFNVKNTGSMAGTEVAQVYVGFPDIAEGNEPPEQLKEFRRVYLSPGETKTVTVKLDAQSFSYWNTTQHAWRVQPGNYKLMVGVSSEDICLSKTVNMFAGRN